MEKFCLYLQIVLKGEFSGIYLIYWWSLMFNFKVRIYLIVLLVIILRGLLIMRLQRMVFLLSYIGVIYFMFRKNYIIDIRILDSIEKKEII